MVEPGDLPAAQREVLEAWRAGSATWAAERERVLADPELERFLVDNLVLQMVRSYDRAAIGSAQHLESPFNRAQAELVRLHASSVPVLVELLLVGDDIVAFLAADTLRRIGAPAVDAVAARIEVPVVEQRRRVVELLGALPESPSGEPALLGKLERRVAEDEAWIVRAQAARSLGARGARRTEKGPAVAALARALSDPDPEVVRTAVQGLELLGDRSAIPVLIRQLERAALAGDLHALRRTQQALRQLSGESRDLEPDQWWAQWEAHGAKPR